MTSADLFLSLLIVAITLAFIAGATIGVDVGKSQGALTVSADCKPRTGAN